MFLSNLVEKPLTLSSSPEEKLTNYIYDKALIFLSSKPRTLSEIDRRVGYYLKNIKGYSDSKKSEIKQTIIQKLKDAKLLNDSSYVDQYIKEKLNIRSFDSKMKMRTFLSKKGIDQVSIDNAVKKIPPELENEKIGVLAAKKLPTIKSHNLREKRQKLVTFLLRKGFRYEQVSTIVDTLLNVK